MMAAGHTWRRIVRNRTIVAVAAVLAGIVIVSIVGPWLSPHDYLRTNFDRLLQGPGLDDLHFFGTDDLGRDLFVRTMQGVQITMLVAVVASFVSLVIGVLYGAIAGFVGGRIDAIMMRFVDTLYLLPFIFFVILLMVAFERNFLLIFVAIGAINWLDMARIVRGQTLSLREREFEWLPGQCVEIPPDTVLRMEALEHSVILETSTPELHDVVRLEDRYGRA